MLFVWYPEGLHLCGGRKRRGLRVKATQDQEEASPAPVNHLEVWLRSPIGMELRHYSSRSIRILKRGHHWTDRGIVDWREPESLSGVATNTQKAFKTPKQFRRDGNLNTHQPNVTLYVFKDLNQGDTSSVYCWQWRVRMTVRFHS